MRAVIRSQSVFKSSFLHAAEVPQPARAAETHVILIPTCDRPAELRETLESFLVNAGKHDALNVKIVVLDESTRAKSLRQNEKVIRGARTNAWPSRTPIFYYNRSKQKEFLDLLAKRTSPQTVARIIPEKKSVGRARNFISLLGVFHGGKKSLFHHVDDDFTLKFFPIGRQGPLRNLYTDFFRDQEIAAERSGHAICDLVGVADVVWGRKRKSFNESVKSGLALLNRQLAGGKKIGAEKTADALLSLLEPLSKGRIPMEVGMGSPLPFTGEKPYVKSNPPSGRSVSYELLTAYPFSLGVSGSDWENLRLLTARGHPAYVSYAYIYHSSGTQKNPFPLDFSFFSGELSSLRENLSGTRRNALPKKVRLVSNLLRDYAPKLRTRNRYSRPYYTKQPHYPAGSNYRAVVEPPRKTMASWRSLVRCVERLRTQN